MIANFEPLPTGGAGTQSLVPITPCRILDTRPEYGFPALFGAPALEAGVRTIPVAQSTCGIPANASAYALNITVIPLEPLSFLTAHPNGQAVPGTSTLNAADGRITSNGTIVKAGVGGAISLYATNRTHVIIDITGYFSLTAPALYGIFGGKCRALDTRQGTALIPG